MNASHIRERVWLALSPVPETGWTYTLIVFALGIGADELVRWLA